MKKDTRGFSLVELIIVIAIMAILTGAITPAVIKYIRNARESRCEQNRKNVELDFNAEATSRFPDIDMNAAQEKALVKEIVEGYGGTMTLDDKILGICGSDGIISYTIDEHKVIHLTCSEHPN